ncbi:MAG: HAMP domain-containing histidine kinase [Labilithrix sp.]|nr:HAMP domain-containing histidine kinase [Labilithrix sp.]MCW5817731.1 HAMP domain-containing histidine kinase [Labilithrix sp.]
MSTRRAGLRLQLLLALAGVILVAYVPLFFAIAQVTRASALADRDDAARALGRAIAAHVADVRAYDPSALERVVRSHTGEQGALAIGVFGPEGDAIASSGEELPAPAPPYGERTARAVSAGGVRALDVTLPSGASEVVVVRVGAEDDRARTGKLVRGVALYMSVFALALLVFAYITLTRTIVRPIEQLARAADRVANGARDLDLPSAGAREVVDLGSSVRAMATRLLAEEKALRGKVDELTATSKRLGETREQLAGSERMASVGRLAAGVAHEIGNPIAAIMGMHDLLADDMTDDETRADFLRRMRKETERIHVVVKDLLDYARPEDDGPDSVRSLGANVAEIVDDALALVRPQKDFKSIAAAIEVPSDLRVALSPQRFTQVLLNLFLNAGAALAGRPEPRELRVRARSEEGLVTIEVEDNGPGIAPELRARVFDPFVTTKEVGAGTGLGLAVVRGIVEGAKGKIRIDPTYANGARFVLELPGAPAS